MLADLLAPQERLRSGRFVAAFEVEAAHPDIDVCRSAQRRFDGAIVAAQADLVRAHGLAETSLGDPDVRQGDRAPEGVRRVPGLEEALHALAVDRCAASRSPPAQYASPSSPAAPARLR